VLNVSVRKIQYRLKEYRAAGLLPQAQRPVGSYGDPQRKVTTR
jgi:hypothetical protein